MGRPLPGYHIALLDPDDDVPVDEGEIAIDLARPPLGLMTAYRGGVENLRVGWEAASGWIGAQRVPVPVAQPEELRALLAQKARGGKVIEFPQSGIRS